MIAAWLFNDEDTELSDPQNNDPKKDQLLLESYSNAYSQKSQQVDSDF